MIEAVQTNKKICKKYIKRHMNTKLGYYFKQADSGGRLTSKIRAFLGIFSIRVRVGVSVDTENSEDSRER